jgi:hypothetical protein
MTDYHSASSRFMELLQKTGVQSGKMGLIIKERNLMEKELILTYQPEKEDYIKASRTLAMNTTSFILVGLLIFFVVIASVVVLFVPAIGSGSWRSTAFVGLAMGAFFIVNFWLIIPYQLSKAYKQNENLRKERKLVINDAGVRMQIGERATDFPWENFQRVVEHDRFYLMIYKAEERVYPFIPQRAFENESSEEDFRAVLKNRAIPVK